VISSGAGNATYALAYLGRNGDDETVIIVERGLPGQPETRAFVQRFRPRRGPFRRFKRLGELEPVGDPESAPQAGAAA
jgi:hypothetical protein